MKNFNNKTTEIKKDETSFTTFKDLATVCVNQIPQGGLDVMQMKNRLNVLNKLENANGKISLEDAEADTLKDCVKAMKWAIMHKDLVEFIETVEKL